MHPSSKTRRTNFIIINVENWTAIKQYRNFPLSAVGPVLCRIRSPSTMFGRHRCRVEEKKAKLVKESGLPLAVEYIYFALNLLLRPRL